MKTLGAASNDQVLLDTLLAQRRAERSLTLPEDEFFEYFVVEEALHSFDLSIDEIDAGLVDGSGDGGVDALYVMLNGKPVETLDDDEITGAGAEPVLNLYVFQTKLGRGFSEVAVQKLTAFTRDLLDLTKDLSNFEGIYNEEVLDIVNGFRNLFVALASSFPRVRLAYTYACKGARPNPSVIAHGETLKAAITELFPDAEIEVTFLGARELLQLARRRKQGAIDLRLAEGPLSSGGTGGVEGAGYVGLVDLADYYDFITEEPGVLRKVMFESNVRDYEGLQGVNQAIARTLDEGKGEDFWWLNNGVTVVAQRVTQRGKTLVLDDPQIVNGLQTSTELFKHLSKGSEPPTDHRQVLVRIIIPSDETSRDEIIRATNSQTAIPHAALRATDPIQRDIEEYFAEHGLFYERRKNQYRDSGRPAERIISMAFLASAATALLLGQPERATLKQTRVLRSDALYQEIFNAETSLRGYLNAALVASGARSFVSTQAAVRGRWRARLIHLTAWVAARALLSPAPPNRATITGLSEQAIERADYAKALDTVLQARRERSELRKDPGTRNLASGSLGAFLTRR